MWLSVFRFGGEMLGPSRFTHIETCAREACRDFKVADELRDAVLTLQTLDDDLAKHRVTLAALSETQAPSDINEDASTSKDTGDNTTEDTGKDTVVPDITTVPSTSTTTLAAITAAKEDTSEALLGKRKRPVADTSASKYEDLVSSRDVKKARRLITARENAVRTVKGMLQKKQEEQLEQAKEKEQVERRHEEGKQEHGKQENGKQEEGTQEERVVVVEQNESSVPSIIDELFEAEKNSKPQPRLDGHGTEST
jgi:DNA-binding protein H-NS